MVRVIMHGCNGHMGQVITELIEKEPEMEIVAGVDMVDNRDNGYPVFTSLDVCQTEADVMIDFSSYKAADGILDYCVKRQLPLVLCTTGLTEAQLEKVGACSEKVAILRSANMSLGINLMLKLLQEAARALAGAGFDIEIVEKHHRRKCDAPSGTALALADSINGAMDDQYHYVYDRSPRHQQREDMEIGISSVRGGTIVGDHDVIFAGPDEVVTFSHRAYSRTIFGKGAVEAAKFMAGREPGMYDMQDVICHQSKRSAD